MPPVEPGKKPAKRNHLQNKRNQLSYTEHNTDCYLIIFKLFPKELLS